MLGLICGHPFWPWARLKQNKECISWMSGIKFGHQVLLWPWPWPWIFKVEYSICYISRNNDCHNKKQTSRLNARPEMWPPISTLAIKYSTIYIDKKGPNTMEWKTNTDWTFSTNFTQQFLLWPWPWHWIFKAEYLISCISGKMVWLPWNKQTKHTKK